MKTTKADKYFSLYIRIRDAKTDYLGQCCTCGKWGDIRTMDNGHYIKRQHQATRFNEFNCALQCKRCNNFEQGADVKFRKHLVDRFGEDKILLVEASKRQSVKRSASDMKQLEKYWKEKAIEIATEKGIKIW